MDLGCPLLRGSPVRRLRRRAATIIVHLIENFDATNAIVSEICKKIVCLACLVVTRVCSTERKKMQSLLENKSKCQFTDHCSKWTEAPSCNKVVLRNQDIRLNLQATCKRNVARYLLLYKYSLRISVIFNQKENRTVTNFRHLRNFK